jgi:hypothetical protein
MLVQSAGGRVRSLVFSAGTLCESITRGPPWCVECAKRYSADYIPPLTNKLLRCPESSHVPNLTYNSIVLLSIQRTTIIKQPPYPILQRSLPIINTSTATQKSNNRQSNPPLNHHLSQISQTLIGQTSDSAYRKKLQIVKPTSINAPYPLTLFPALLPSKARA